MLAPVTTSLGSLALNPGCPALRRSFLRGYIKKLEQIGLDEAFLGLLVLKAKLADVEAITLVDRILQKLQFQRFETVKELSFKEIPTSSFKKLFKEIRPKVNL